MTKKITDLSAEEPTEGADTAYARTRMRSKFEVGGQAGELSATFKAETEGPADHADVSALGRGLGLACAIVLGLLPAIAVAVLCSYAGVAAWIAVGLPMVVWVLTTVFTTWYMRRR